MSSPSDEPRARPKQDPARIAGIGVLVAAGASIFYWGISQSRHRDAVPPNVPAAPATSLEAPVTGLEALVKAAPTAENYLNLSLAYAHARRFQDQIAAAQQAIRLKPDLAEAYNNLAAGYEDLRMWDQAIAAAQQAIRLRPDFQLARNNLAWALAQQAKSR